jgi:uncharacterized membrane protein
MPDFWIAMVLLISAFNYVIPRLTRRDIFFSVTVTPGFRARPEARRILAGYRRGIIIVTAIALVLVIAELRSGSALAGAGLLMLQLLAALGTFVSAHRRTIAYKSVASSAREASLEPQPRMPGLGLVLVGPYLMLACAALLIWAHWNEIPDPMPVHWDLAGNPNGWLPKTPLIFIALTGSEFAMCAILTFAVVAMLYFSRQVAVTGATALEGRRFRWIGIAIILAGSYLSAALAYLPLNPQATLAFGGVAFFFVIMTVGSLELVRRGQGGVRLAPVHGEEVVADRTPDQCWKWGIFYYNPHDPALMVEKRFGIGWTLNFAHGGAWAFMGLVLASLIVALSMPLLARYR